MSDSSAFGFGKFIPGFEFLQSLGAAGKSAAATPPFSHWVAPTMSIEDIDKRINELKAVQFWLEQNSKALAATVQALEVQKMTLSTLKGMNVNFAEMSKAFPFASTGTNAAQPEAPAASAQLSDWPLTGSAEQPAREVPEQPAEPAEPAQEPPNPAADSDNTAQAASMAAASQWWSALTQQFQHIAQQAIQDPVQQQAVAQATQMTTEFAKTAVKAASDLVQQTVAKAAPATASASTASARAASAAAKKKPAPTPAKKADKATKAAKATPSPRAAVHQSTSADKKATSARVKPAARATKQSVARKTPTR